MSKDLDLDEVVNVSIQMSRRDLNKLTFLWSANSYKEAAEACLHSSLDAQKFNGAYNGEIPFSEMPVDNVLD